MRKQASRLPHFHCKVSLCMNNFTLNEFIRNCKHQYRMILSLILRKIKFKICTRRHPLITLRDDWPPTLFTRIPHFNHALRTHDPFPFPRTR